VNQLIFHDETIKAGAPFPTIGVNLIYPLHRFTVMAKRLEHIGGSLAASELLLADALDGQR
jgi:hypothetical protein